MSFSYTSSDYIHHVTWKEPLSQSTMSKFDIELESEWNAKMAKGKFKYDIKDLTSRVVPGKMQYIVQLNEKRAIERRLPEIMESMRKPFNPNKFNFTKVDKDEIIFHFCPDTEVCKKPESKDCSGTSESSCNEHCGKHAGREKNNCEAIKGGVEGTVNVSTNGSSSVCNGVRQSHTEAAAQECLSTEKMKACGRHLVLINISPLENKHVLLVPDVDDCIPQRITLNGMRLAVDIMLLSALPGWRVGFNSLCGMASVNHQHLHAWCLNHRLTIESSKVNKVCENLFELTTDHPTTGFVFQLHGNTVPEFVRRVHKVVSYLQENEIAHNFLLTRGTRLDHTETSADDLETSTVRAYIWPRKSQTDLKTYSAESQVFNVAVAELGGFVPVYVAESYRVIDEEYISSKLSEEMLTNDEFERVRNDIARLIADS